MQEFLEDGNLFPGIHHYSFSDFEKQFVTNFPTSSTRKRIFNNLKEWLLMLTDILIPRYIWLNGSYLTTKVDPNDIDLVVFYAPEDIIQLGEEKTKKLKEVINDLSANYDCDAYFCYTFEQSPIEIVAQFPEQAKIMQTYWKGQFCFDRQRRPKGIIELKQELIYELIGGVENDFASR